MRRCKDCAKWREHRGYCPIYATQKAAVAKMCKWMAHEQNLEYMRGYMKERCDADKAKAAKAKKGATRRRRNERNLV